MTIFPLDMSLVEIINLLSAPFAVYIAWRALIQIKLMKKQNEELHLQNEQVRKDALLREEKEAFQKAIDLCDRFRTEYLNNNPELSELKDLTITSDILAREPDTFTLAELLGYESGEAAYHYVTNQDNSKLYQKAIDALNFLEYFSMGFTTNIAEKNIAFAPLHNVFVSHIRILYPYICLVNDSPDSRLYNNVIKLYKDWSGQLADIANRRNSMEREGSRLADEVIANSFAPVERRHNYTSTTEDAEV